MDERILRIVAQALPCDPKILSADSGFSRTHNWDSLGHVRVMSALEHEFGVELTPQVVGSLLTVSDIEDFILGL